MARAKRLKQSTPPSVGARVWVYWSAEKRWFEGVVIAADAATADRQVEYFCDADVRWHDLSRMKWTPSDRGAGGGGTTARRKRGAARKGGAERGKRQGAKAATRVQETPGLHDAGVRKTQARRRPRSSNPEPSDGDIGSEIEERSGPEPVSDAEPNRVELERPDDEVEPSSSKMDFDDGAHADGSNQGWTEYPDHNNPDSDPAESEQPYPRKPEPSGLLTRLLKAPQAWADSIWRSF